MGRTPPGRADLELQTTATVQEEEWDRMIGSFSGTFLHSFAWSRYIGRAHGPVSYVTARCSGRPVAAGWYTVSGNRGRWPGLARQLQLETLPGFDRRAIEPAAVFGLVTDLARQQGCLGLSFGNSEPHYLADARTGQVDEKINFQHDLRTPLDAIHAGLHERHRSRIRKAASLGIEVRALGAPECTEQAGALGQMFTCSLQRHLSAGKDRRSGEVCSVPHIIQDLVRTKAATVFAAFLRNRPVSCSVVGSFSGHARMLYAASSEQGYGTSASFLLFWRIIEHYHALGAKLLDLGEVPRRSENSGDQDHGLYRYKAGFGGRQRIVCSGTAVTRPALHALVSVLRSCRRLLKGGHGV